MQVFIVTFLTTMSLLVEELLQPDAYVLKVLVIGVWRDRMWPDGWTAVTADGKRSAQFEHTLLVTSCLPLAYFCFSTWLHLIRCICLGLSVSLLLWSLHNL